MVSDVAYIVAVVGVVVGIIGVVVRFWWRRDFQGRERRWWHRVEVWGVCVGLAFAVLGRVLERVG
jgi:hypothetical protein